MQIQKILYKSFIGTLVCTTTLYSTPFENYKHNLVNMFQNNKQEFINYKSASLHNFDAYKKAQQKAYNSYKNELLKYWDNPELTEETKLVHYTKDKKTKTAIDFKHKLLQIETIAKSKKEAEKKIKKALIKAVSINTQELYKNDALLQKLSHIPKPKNMVNAKIDPKPILSNVVFSQTPDKEDLLLYTKKTLLHTKIKSRKNKRNKNIFTLNVKLPKNTNYKRSMIYRNEVSYASKKEKIPRSLIFAIMHTESSFNPYARSYVPAYGLMQIVPKTAGIDAYFYLYGKKRLVTGNYLYNSKNNIKMGSAYLHILYYRYLKDIKDPQSRLYCTIAAYNTGAGNVSRAFVNSYNTHKAAKVINRLTPDEVYAKLLQDLRYEEPKKYLKNVTKRMKIYQKIYES